MPRDTTVHHYDVEMAFRFIPRNVHGDALDRDTDHPAGGKLTFTSRTSAANIGEAGTIMHEMQEILDRHRK